MSSKLELIKFIIIHGSSTPESAYEFFEKLKEIQDRSDLPSLYHERMDLLQDLIKKGIVECVRTQYNNVYRNNNNYYYRYFVPNKGLVMCPISHE